jgi:hypothetical protein
MYSMDGILNSINMQIYSVNIYKQLSFAFLRLLNHSIHDPPQAVVFEGTHTL